MGEGQQWKDNSQGTTAHVFHCCEGEGEEEGNGEAISLGPIQEMWVESYLHRLGLGKPVLELIET